MFILLFDTMNDFLSKVLAATTYGRREEEEGEGL
jgi:hypothetical protein